MHWREADLPTFGLCRKHSLRLATFRKLTAKDGGMDQSEAKRLMQREAENAQRERLLAGLPAGTVSGAPKVRAMEIIDELEPEKRGIYGGGVGYFAANGEMDMCIALRTAVLKDGVLYIQAGGGVVHDSDPEAEYEETVNKSSALRRAAEDAGLFAGRGNG